MIADIIVAASVALALLFVAAWAVSPRLRAWIEKPKYRFQDALTDYDRSEQQHRRSGEQQHRRSGRSGS